MKKLTLLCALFLPAISMANVSINPFNLNYTGTVKGHNATINKTLVIANNTCTTTAQITVNAFITKVVNQTATATCNGNTIIPLTFSVDGDTTTLNQGVFDTLDLPTFLGNSLVNTQTISSSPIQLSYNGNIVSVICAIANINASITTGAGQTLPATSVVCASADKTVVLNYMFSNDKSATMLSVADPGNDTQVGINSYPA